MIPFLLKRLKAFDDFTADRFDGAAGKRAYRFPIFHYTNADAALSILQSNSFRFMNAFFHRGDVDETWAGIEIGHKCANRFSRSLSKLKRDFHIDFRETLNTALPKRFFFGICCFTELASGEEHWHHHASEHSGVQIGLRDHNFEVPSSGKMFSLAMQYDADRLAREFKEIINELDSLFCEREIRRAINSENREFFLKKARVSLALSIVNEAVTFKRPKFSWEKEVRLLLIIDVANLPREKTCYDPDGVPRYVTLKLQRTADDRDAIQSVIVGRNARSELISEVETTLERAGTKFVHVTPEVLDRPLLIPKNL